VLLSLAQALAPAQVVAAQNADDVAMLQSRIALLESRSDIPTGERSLALEQLRAALARLESAAAARVAAERYNKELQDASTTIAQLSAESDTPMAAAPINASLDDSVQLQLQLASMQASAATLRSRSQVLSEQLRALVLRPAAARLELVGLRHELARTQVAVPAGASALQLEVGHIRDDAVRQDLSARIAMIEQELLSLPTREAIAAAQRDLAARQLQQADLNIAALEKRIQQLREDSARLKVNAAQAAVRDLAGRPVALRNYAAATAAIRSSLADITNSLAAARLEHVALRVRLKQVAEARDNAEQIFSIGRLGDEQGKLLRGLQKSLPVSATLERAILSRNDQLTEVRLARFETEQELRPLDDLALAAQHYLVDQGIEAADNKSAMLLLVESRRAALLDLAALQRQRIDALVQVNALESELQQSTVQLRRQLGERLLWLPSATPVDATWLSGLAYGANWLFAPDNLWRAGRGLSNAVIRRPLVVLLFIVTLGALLASRSRLFAILGELAKPVGRRDDRFNVTLAALLVTLMLAIPVPFAVGFAGWLLGATSDTTNSLAAWGNGLISTAIVLFMLGLFRTMCLPEGLFIAHFHWSPAGTRRLGRALRLLALAIAPAALLTSIAATSGDLALIEGMGRFGFVLGSLALTLFLYRVFRPQGGALTGGLNRKGLAWRTRRIWFWGIVATPIVLAALAMAGYFVTASELQARLFTSGWILLATIIVFDVGMRGVTVAGRRAAYEQADARRAKAFADAVAKAAADASGEVLPQLQEESIIDVVAVSQQTRILLRAAAGLLLTVLLWGIWSSIFPALNVFNDVVLWSHVVTTTAGDTIQAVTLGHVLLSLLILTLTFVAARNLPGFLEVVLLQRYARDAGARYAIVAISRYAIFALGLFIAFSRIGVDWSQLQWIVAALGVGLGFGLQEIVANFVSGIIILFERPVRVGDLISIGNTTGTVSRIKIRAITITDADNFEVLVPNKAFITGTVQNWSLTSTVTRLVIKIGIAYDSDVGLARKIMLDTAQAHPQVLASPVPSVLFLGFGDSALAFELRVFVGKIEHRLSTHSDLHTELHSALKRAGIEIPFPQRDVNIRRSRDSAGAD